MNPTCFGLSLERDKLREHCNLQATVASDAAAATDVRQAPHADGDAPPSAARADGDADGDLSR